MDKDEINRLSGISKKVFEIFMEETIEVSLTLLVYQSALILKACSQTHKNDEAYTQFCEMLEKKYYDDNVFRNIPLWRS